MEKHQRSKALIAFGAALVVCMAISTVAAIALTTATQGWSTYRNAKFGFQISYPGGLFVTSQDKPPLKTARCGYRLTALPASSQQRRRTRRTRRSNPTVTSCSRKLMPMRRSIMRPSRATGSCCLAARAIQYSTSASRSCAAASSSTAGR